MTRWNVVYDRHYLYCDYKQSVFETRYFWLASLVYAFWTFAYLMCEFQVKRLMIYQTKDGIRRIDTMRYMTTYEFKKYKSKRRNKGNARITRYPS